MPFTYDVDQSILLVCPIELVYVNHFRLESGAARTGDYMDKEWRRRQRNDFLHKTSSKLISENQAIAVESLNVSGMLKNHCLAQAISDVSWSEFFRQLEYKAEWCGKTLLKIGQFEPSSKLCNVCGHHNGKMTLKDRDWCCPKCNTEHDRDINAAINIKKFALQNQNLLNV
ncbi:RNA-guided endonuclease TnpB family protein [Methanolobus sp. ZRKC3]